MTKLAYTRSSELDNPGSCEDAAPWTPLALPLELALSKASTCSHSLRQSEISHFWMLTSLFQVNTLFVLEINKSVPDVW